MEGVNKINIPKEQTFEWGKFLKRRETYRDLLGLFRHSITFIDQCAVLPPAVKTGIAVLKLGAPVSIRPDLEDVKEQVSLVQGAAEHRHVDVLAQNSARLTSRGLTVLIAVTTVYSGFSTLRGNAYALPLVFTTVKEFLGEALSARAYRSGRCLEAAIAGKSNKELLEWIGAQVKIGPGENNLLTLKYADDKYGNTSEKAALCRASLEALENQKKQWLRDAMGDAALKVALTWGELPEGAREEQVKAAAEFIRAEIKLKKAINLSNLIKDIIPCLGVLCLYRGGSVKKYASLCYAITAFISLPDARLHRQVAKWMG